MEVVGGNAKERKGVADGIVNAMGEDRDTDGHRYRVR